MPAWVADIDRAGGRTIAAAWVADPTAMHRAVAAAAARDGIADLTLDECTLALVVHSEDGNASAATIAAIADATVNRANRAGRSILATATGGHGYGAQGGGRPMSTARGPSLRCVRAAVAVTRGDAAGASSGATSWLHQRTQDVLARRDPARNCPARVIVERWCWGCKWRDVDADGRRTSCRLGQRNAPALEWVGPLEGVDHRRILLFRPATAAHAAQWEAVQAVLGAGGTLTGAAVALGLVLAVAASGAV